MNSLDDLRRTLDAHASASTDGTHPIWDADALHARIDRTRRRRAATRGAVALAAVAAVAGTALLPRMLDGDRTPDPADRTAFGDIAPLSLTAADRTYAWQALDSTAKQTLTLTPEPGPDHGYRTTAPLLSWTTQDDDAVVTVTDQYDSTLWSSEDSDFRDHVVLDAWLDGPVTVTSSEPGLAVATYRFDASAPVPGDTAGGITFPARIGDQRLLGSAVSEAGSTSVRLDLTGVTKGTRIAVATVCTGGIPEAAEPKKGEPWLRVDLNGEEASSGSCSDTEGIAQPPSFSMETDTDLKSVEATLEAYRSSTPIAAGTYPEARLAVAVYTASEHISFHSVVAERTMVANGHTWRAVQVERGGPDTPVEVTLDGTGPWLASASVSAKDSSTDDEAYTRIAPLLQLRVDGHDLAVDDTRGSTHFTGEEWIVALTGPVIVPVGSSTVSLPAIDVPAAEESQVVLWELAD